MIEPVLTALQEATKDLLYMSESDEPFEVVQWENVPHFGTQTLLEGRKNAPTQVLSLEEFFKDLTKEEKWHGPEEKAEVQRYRKLKETINKHLSDTQVFRIGKTKVDIFIVGKTQEGHRVGIKTKAIET